MALIAIENMEFFSYHGCFREENIIGTRFIVDFYCEADTKAAQQTDDLSKTINYQRVYHLIKAEMDQASKLLEHVAQRILIRAHAEYEQMDWAEVKVQKMNPPLGGGKIGSVSVSLSTDDVEELAK